MTLSDVIIDFSSKNSDKILKLCDPLFSIFGFNYFFMQSSTPNGRFGALGTHPDLMLDYIQKKFHTENPFINNFHELQSGIYLYESIEHPQFQQAIGYLEKEYNVRHCCIIIEKYENYTIQWGMGFPVEKKGISSLLVNQLVLIKKFIKYFRNEASSIVNDVLNNRVNLSHELSPIKSGVPEIIFTTQNQIKFLSRIGGKHDSLQKIQLTPREIQCLKLYVRGKSSRLIAQELSLSKRTVEHFLENIKDKLNCLDKSELFDRLFLLKDLNIYQEIFE